LYEIEIIATIAIVNEAVKSILLAITFFEFLSDLFHSITSLKMKYRFNNKKINEVYSLDK
jgi:hypothetical protein